MEISFGLLPTLLLWAALFFAIYYVLYYRFIYSVIDPLFVFVFTTSFASVLAIYIIPTLEDLTHFFCCQISVWLGFFVAHRNASYLHHSVKLADYKYSFSEQTLLRWITYFLLCVFILSNGIIGYAKGFALLSDAPSSAKFANFQEGFGVFRKMNWALSTFVTISLAFLYFSKKRRLDLFLLGVVAFFSSLEGSKSAFLQIAIAAGIVFYHPAFSGEQILLKKIKRYLPFAFIGILGIVFIVLLKENDGLDGASLAFIRRLLYSSDSLIYFYTPINMDYFSGYSFSEYFSRLVNPILGFVRLQPYQEALGNILYDNLIPPGNTPESITVGPNAPFYMEGRIYFYYWGAFPYCALVGYSYAATRVYFFSLACVSSFYFVFVGSFCYFAQAILIDSNLAVTQLFNLFFFIIPPFIIFSFLLTGKVNINMTNLLRPHKKLELE